MQIIYPAVLKKTQTGYTGYFPDLEGCIFRGDDLEDALEDARHAMSAWIDVEMEEEFPSLPPVSDGGDLTLEDDEFFRVISMTLRLYDGYDE